MNSFGSTTGIGASKYAGLSYGPNALATYEEEKRRKEREDAEYANGESAYGKLQDAANQSALLNQKGGIDLTQGQQDGSYNILQALINKGYIDDNQRIAAQGRYTGAMDQLKDAYGRTVGFSETGGYGEEEYGALMGGYNDAYGKLADVAGRGAMTDAEYNNNLTSARQDVLDRFKSAASSGFNALQNKGAATFAGMSVMAQGAREAGANQASARAALDQYQADTRMKGMEGMRNTVDSASSLAGNRAGNKLSAIDQLRGLTETNVGIADRMADLDTKTMSSTNQGLMNSAMSDLGNLSSVQGGKATTPYSNQETPWADVKTAKKTKSNYAPQGNGTNWNHRRTI